MDPNPRWPSWPPQLCKLNALESYLQIPTCTPMKMHFFYEQLLRRTNQERNHIISFVALVLVRDLSFLILVGSALDINVCIHV